MKQRVHELCSLAQDFAVGLALRSPRLEDSLHAQGFRTTEFLVSQICVVNHLAQRLESFFAKVEFLEQRLKTAVITAMPESNRLVHVEGNRVGPLLGMVGKSECGLAIDKSLNEPGACHSVDPRPWPGYPCPSNILPRLNRF